MPRTVPGHGLSRHNQRHPVADTWQGSCQARPPSHSGNQRLDFTCVSFSVFENMLTPKRTVDIQCPLSPHDSLLPYSNHDSKLRCYPKQGSGTAIECACRNKQGPRFEPPRPYLRGGCFMSSEARVSVSLCLSPSFPSTSPALSR